MKLSIIISKAVAKFKRHRQRHAEQKRQKKQQKQEQREQEDSQKRRKRVMINIALGVAVLNAASFIGMHSYWSVTGQTGAVLREDMAGNEPIYDEKSGKEIVTYVVGGNLGDSRQAMKRFISDELIIGKVVYVQYVNKGFDLELITRQVIDDVKRRDCYARIIGISIGAYVANMADAELPDMDAIVICPEPECSLLKPWAYNSLRALVRPVRAATSALGWIRQIPLISCCDRRWSVGFLLDQWDAIGHATAPRVCNRTIAVFVTGIDQYLDHLKIYNYYKDTEARVYLVDGADHGNTIDKYDCFIKPWQKMMTETGAYTK